MPRRGVGGAPNDPTMHDVRQEMARLPLLSRTAMVRAGDTSPTELKGVPAGGEGNWRVWRERRMTRADGRGRPHLPRRQPDGIDTNKIASEGRLRVVRTISAWHSGRGPVRSDGRAGAAPVRSYLAAMRRNYQRERPKTIRQGRTNDVAAPGGTSPRWHQTRAHFQRSRSDGETRDASASWAGETLCETMGASTRDSSRRGVPRKGRWTPSAWECLSLALRPFATGARAKGMCSDLSRRGTLWHDNEKNDDVRSEDCWSIVDGRRHGRRLSANLISDEDQERPRTEKGTDLGENTISWASAGWDGTTGAGTRSSSRRGAPWMGRRTPPAGEGLSQALRPTT